MASPKVDKESPEHDMRVSSSAPVAPAADLSRPRLSVVRSDDIVAIHNPETGRIIGFHGQEMEVAELAPDLWSALTKGQNSPGLSVAERDALNELALWKIPAKNLSQDSESSAKTAAPHDAAIRSLTINVAQVCNLACTYCAAGGDGTYGSKIKTPEFEKTRQQLAMLLEKVPRGRKFAITFLGGEPLLVPQLIEAIAREARLLVAGREIELRFDIVTNGTLVTPEIAELLAGLKAHVTVSIDGAPEDNDKARVTKSGQGSSAMILKGLQHLIEVRERLGSLCAGSVFSSKNLNVVEAWKFLTQFPFDSIKFDFAAEIGDELSSKKFAEGMSRTAQLAFEKGGERELRRIHNFDHLFQILDAGVKIENHCLAGKNHLQLDTNGRFTACQWFVGQADEILGEGLNLDLSSKNSKLAGFSDALIEKTGCRTCWARHICGGGCMHVNKVKTGNKHRVDQAYCDRTRTIIAKGIERYAEARYANQSQLEGAGQSEIH